MTKKMANSAILAFRVYSDHKCRWRVLLFLSFLSQKYKKKHRALLYKAVVITIHMVATEIPELVLCF